MQRGAQCVLGCEDSRDSVDHYFGSCRRLHWLASLACRTPLPSKCRFRLGLLGSPAFCVYLYHAYRLAVHRSIGSDPARAMSIIQAIR
eukprot:9478129-Pyramimonas_sp.AAC.1